MITESAKLFYDCHVLIENNALDLKGVIKTDGELWYLITNEKQHINQEQYTNTLKNKNEYSLAINNIIKISDDCYSFKSSDIKFVNIKFFELMHDWNVRYVYLIDHINVFQD